MLLFLVFLSLTARIIKASQSGFGSPINNALNFSAIKADRVWNQTVPFNGYNGSRHTNQKNNNVNVETKIVDGKEAIPHEFPHILRVDLYKRQNSHHVFHCGASIIDENYALTAAHCVEGEFDFTIRVVAGEHDRSKKEGTEVKRNISKITMHHDYSGKPHYKNDIALLKFKTPINFNDYIQPINMATRNYVTTGNVVVSGWGDTSYPNGKSSKVLRKAEVPVVSIEKCKKRYPHQNVDDTQICAGHMGGRPDACEGDSGGPLMKKARRGNNHILVGIVSYGIRCGRPNSPTIYTSVAKYRNWIDGCSSRIHAQQC